MCGIKSARGCLESADVGLTPADCYARSLRRRATNSPIRPVKKRTTELGSGTAATEPFTRNAGAGFGACKLVIVPPAVL